MSSYDWVKIHRAESIKGNQLKQQADLCLNNLTYDSTDKEVKHYLKLKRRYWEYVHQEQPIDGQLEFK